MTDIACTFRRPCLRHDRSCVVLLSGIRSTVAFCRAFDRTTRTCRSIFPRWQDKESFEHCPVSLSISAYLGLSVWLPLSQPPLSLSPFLSAVSFFRSLNLSFSLSVSLSDSLCHPFSVCQSICVSGCLCVSVAVFFSVSLTVCLSVSLTVRPSVCLSVCLSV